MSHLRNPRTLAAACVVAVAAVAAVVVLPRTGDGADPEPPRVVRASLTLEAFRRPDTGERELLVSLATPQLNRPDVTGGAKVVLLRCLDAGGAEVIRQPAGWPLVEEEGYAPHIHQPADAPLLASIRACRLTGPGIALEGRVTRPLRVSQ